MDSRSLRPVLEGKTEKHREYVLSGLKTWRMAWDGRYKYITGFGKEGDTVFDLAEDPLEDRNLGRSAAEGGAAHARSPARTKGARASASA